MIPSPGPRAGSQMPEISWRGAGPGFDAAFTGRPQPSRSAGADEGACWPFCAAGLAAGAPWDRADIDDPNTINMMRTEIAKLLGIFVSTVQCRQPDSAPSDSHRATQDAALKAAALRLNLRIPSRRVPR